MSDDLTYVTIGLTPYLVEEVEYQAKKYPNPHAAAPFSLIAVLINNALPEPPPPPHPFKAGDLVQYTNNSGHPISKSPVVVVYLSYTQEDGTHYFHGVDKNGSKYGGRNVHRWVKVEL